MMYDAAKEKGNPVAYKTFEGDIKNDLIWWRNFFIVQLHGRLSFVKDYMPDLLTSQCKSDICMDVSREGDSLGTEILFLAQ